AASRPSMLSLSLSRASCLSRCTRNVHSAPAMTASTAIATSALAMSLVRSLEKAQRHVDALVAQLVHQLGHDARGLECADDLAIRAARLLETEDVLEQRRAALHARDLGDALDAAHAVVEAARVHDEVQGGHDLLADRARRQLDAGHEHHRLEAVERVARRVGVHG